MQGSISAPSIHTQSVDSVGAGAGASQLQRRVRRIRRLFSIVVGAILVAWPVRAKPPQVPQPDHHRAEVEYKAMLLRDENGVIAPDGLMNGLVQKQNMSFNAKAWPGLPGAQPASGIGIQRADINSNIWKALGPGNVGGRVRSILVHPTTPTT